jgi:uncharacterized OB-fold protein
MSTSGVSNPHLPSSTSESGKEMFAPTLVCPCCGFETEDTWEVLNQGCIDEMRCESCSKIFVFALMECNHCGVEQGISWLNRPADEVFDHMNCEACGHVYREPDETV